MPKSVDYEIARIGELNREELIAEYQGMFRRDPPGSISRGLLRRVLCYEIRLQAIGGLTPEQKKLFAKVIREEEPKPGSIWEHKTQFKVGTRLRRLWKGKTFRSSVSRMALAWTDRPTKAYPRSLGPLPALAGTVTSSLACGHPRLRR